MDHLRATKAHAVVCRVEVVVGVCVQGDVDHRALLGDGLDLLGAKKLKTVRVPTPDATSRGPDLDGVGILAQAHADGPAQLPRSIGLVAPGV